MLKVGSSQFRIVGDPSRGAWSRVQRYASWMRRIYLDQGWTLEENTLSKLRRSSPIGGWFPALQHLFWRITRSNLSYVDLFLSPHLTKVSISTSLSWRHSRVPYEILPAIASTLFALPTSTLQTLWVSPLISGAALQYPLSSVVLRCGPTLTEFISTVPLSDAAVDHLIRLPRLRACRIEGPPPSYPLSHLPPVSPLTELALGKDAAHGWLSLLERLGASSGVRGTLKSLKLSNSTIDTSFAFPTRIFRNLVDLNVGVFCDGRNGDDQCIFKLDNDNVTELVMALSQLVFLLLDTHVPRMYAPQPSHVSFRSLFIASSCKYWRYTSTPRTSSTISRTSRKIPDSKSYDHVQGVNSRGWMSTKRRSPWTSPALKPWRTE